MSANPFLSEIVLFGFNFAPRGWAQCNGQLLPINQNQALFALLGTTYGGNGQTTFALPDLRGRAAIGFGQGPGLTNYALGQSAGSESATLTDAQMPQHSHAVSPASVTATARSRAGAGTQPTPVNAIPAADPSSASWRYSNAAPDANMAAGSVAIAGSVTASATGGSQAHENRQPYLAMTFCIALQGVFPSQS
jgi:microcystin-dependent protein